MVDITTAFAQGLSLLGVAATVGIVAAPVAWWAAKLAADHSSKTWLQKHKGELDRDLESHKVPWHRRAARRGFHRRSAPGRAVVRGRAAWSRQRAMSRRI